MKRLEKLKREAKESAVFRGHKMNRFRQIDHFAYVSQCNICGKSVYVNLAPMPNEIDIHGEAIALSCTENK